MTWSCYCWLPALDIHCLLTVWGCCGLSSAQGSFNSPEFPAEWPDSFYLAEPSDFILLVLCESVSWVCGSNSLTWQPFRCGSLYNHIIDVCQTLSQISKHCENWWKLNEALYATEYGIQYVLCVWLLILILMFAKLSWLQQIVKLIIKDKCMAFDLRI